VTTSADYTATLSRKRMGAAVLSAIPPTGCCWSVYKVDREIPGGGVDADESPLAAAVRELKEELGMSLVPGRLLVVDWVPQRPGRTDGVMFMYDGGVLDPAHESGIKLPPEELRSWAWSTPTEADSRLSDLLARRVRAALRALSAGVTLYLENGVPVA
jgi:8-oxo-dGTP diphosphatase